MHADQKYIEAFRQNDTRVTRDLYHLYARQAIQWVVKNNGSVADAQDVFQEAVMAIYEKSLDPEFVLTCPIGALLHLIYSRKWIDRLRKESRQREVSFSEVERYESERVEDALTLAESAREAEERQSRLADAFSGLSALCQQMLRLLGEGQPPKDVAAALNMNSVDTLYRRKNACIGRWRELLHGLQTV